MIGHLYRYPHPLDSTRFIYVGQGAKRDQAHRSGKSSFGRRFKEKFLGVELPQPIREEFEVQNWIELNELETIWMFRYHTWRGYQDGMNLQIPGAEDYRSISKFGGQSAVESGQLEKARNYPNRKERWAEILQSTDVKESRKRNGLKQGRINVESGHWDKISKLSDRISAAKKAGAIAVATGQILRIQTKEGSLKGALNQKTEDKVRGGVTQGNRNVESGHLEKARKTALHIRWHVKRNLISPTCCFCCQN